VPPDSTVSHLRAWIDERVAREYEARRFDGFLGRRKHARDEALVLELLGAAPGPLLDLASGTGRFLPVLARGGRRVVACDLSAAMLRTGLARAASRPATAPAGPIARIQASAERLPFADDAFDAALAMRFLFHVEDATLRLRILAELARVTRGPVVGEVRYRRTAKQAARFVRSRVGLARRWRPAADRHALEDELARAGLVLERLVPKSRLFSDKALFRAYAGRAEARTPAPRPAIA
jgi:SAM-dependent methyltransferase